MPTSLPLARLLTALRWALSLALFGVVLWQMQANWPIGQQHQLVCRWPYLAGAVGGGAIFIVSSGLIWKLLLQALGAELRARDACRILFYSNLAKYLPGSVWNMVGRVVLARKMGVPALSASSSILFELVLQMAGALLAALLCLPFLQGSTPFPNWSLWLAAGVLFILLHPAWLQLALTVVWRVTGRTWPLQVPAYRRLLFLGLLVTCNWVILGLSFGCLTRAIVPEPAVWLPEASWLKLCSTFAIAWNIGVITLFAPAGLGVRETALINLLSPAWGAGLAAAVAISARVWILALEALAFLVALGLGGAQTPESTQQPSE